ncbi:ATP-dependent DNA helicase [Trichonephila clavipes]|nr:ATP-dependent DNA helicase [Trichonephila clavipes]
MDFKAAIDSVPKDQKEFKVVINAERKPFGEHKGRFTAPQTKEVAVVIVGQEFEKRDTVLSCRSGTLMRINETHRAYDALQYPLMFCGEDGYQINIPKRHETTKIPLSKTVSASEFYSYQIMERHGEKLKDSTGFVTTKKKLRSEEYIHLKDAITATDGQLSELGKMVVLPSSFTGGSRYMHERTQDAMTYVRYFGRPDLFITFTCNPKWSEIVDLLNQGQKSHDRHDIIARVFRVKVKHMMRLLTKCCIFGNVRCHMYTVEWQKRGLPHVHILLWLKDKIRPESIDKVICAELPDSKLDPALYEIIRSTKETQTGEDGYPQFRRRSPEDAGIVTQIKGNNVDNRWVVPYNPVLSRTFNAHINVEFCNSVKSIKYICKYVNKGTDQATFSVEDQDEVTRRKKGKAVSGYPEIKKDQVLGRVYTVHPGKAECYYLRLLLHKIPGPTSFTALKIVTGVIQPSFQAACKALGLLEDDAHWNSTLEEASISESPNKIRELFAIILVFCQVGDPMKLWEKHRDSLSEDVKKQIEAQQGNIDLYLDIV